MELKQIMKLREERKLRGAIALEFKNNKFVFDGEALKETFQESLEEYRKFLEFNFSTDLQDDLQDEIIELLKHHENPDNEEIVPYLRKGEGRLEYHFYLMSDVLEDSWGADTVIECYKNMLADLKRRDFLC